jgi:hypothetical protein
MGTSIAGVPLCARDLSWELDGDSAGRDKIAFVEALMERKMKRSEFPPALVRARLMSPRAPSALGAFVTGVTIVTLLAFGAAPVAAQDQRLRISVGAAATSSGAGELQPAINTSIGYTFSKWLSFEVDVTAIDRESDRMSGFGNAEAMRNLLGSRNRPADLSAFFGGAGIPDSVLANWGGVGMPFGGAMGPFGSFGGFGALGGLGAGGFGGRSSGHTMIGTLGFRGELPVNGGRLRPYVAGGFGLARTETSFEGRTFDLNMIPADVRAQLGAAALSAFLPTMSRMPESVSRTGLAASAGAGASVRLFRGLSGDVDARYFRLNGERSLVRFGGGVSYRF